MYKHVFEIENCCWFYNGHFNSLLIHAKNETTKATTVLSFLKYNDFVVLVDTWTQLETLNLSRNQLTGLPVSERKYVYTA